MRAHSALAVAALAAALLVAAATAAAAPRLSTIGTFDQPVYVAAPPGDPHRLFVVEKLGTIKLMVDGGTPTTFLDIRDEVRAVDEAGLLSMAFAPDYAASGRFYVYFTVARPGDAVGAVLRIDELHRSAADPNVADESRRRNVLAIQHPTYGNHFGGQLQTGPDGMLWIGTGDGGGRNDPDDNAQDTRSLLGKLLRIDPAPSASAPYTIPADNPHAEGVAAAPEIWAYGLRNPWRFSFDREAGDLTIGDVGQGDREEVDFLPKGTGAGANFGWRCMEGSQPNPNISPCTPSGTYAPPVFDYTHNGRCSLTGGYVVRDADVPTLHGRYVYGDFCTGEVRSLVLAQPAASDDRAESLTVPRVSSFGEDSRGRLYAASLQGPVYRIDEAASTPGAGPPAGDMPGTPPGDTGGSPGDGTASDGEPPELRVDRARRQRLIANRYVSVAVRCSEHCALTTATIISVRTGAATKTFALATRSLMAPAGQRLRLRLRVSKKTRARLAARMKAGQRPLAKVVVTARDAAGNETHRTVHVRAVG
jgi:glucose/arabinose dehydrogenase